MLFLVKGYYTVTHYMQSGDPDKYDVIHPVDAVDDREARQIFEDHYSSMSAPYSSSYYGHVTEVMETLTKKVPT